MYNTDATTQRLRNQVPARVLVAWDGALRGSAQLHPSYSWQLNAKLLGIDLDALVDAAHVAALYEHQERAGQLTLPAELALGVGIGQAMTAVL